MPSSAFSGQKRLPGKEFRSGQVGEMLDDIYKDVEAGFVAVEAAIVAGDLLDVKKASAVLGAETLSANNAVISPTIPVTLIANAGGTIALTLAAPAAGADGQLKLIVKKEADAAKLGNVTISGVIAGQIGGALAFKGEGDNILLVAQSQKWVLIAKTITAP